MNDGKSLLQLIEEAIASLEVALPARNQTAVQLQQILGQDEYDIQQILDVVQSDQALTAEVLRVANSPFYGGLSEITTIQNPTELATIAAERKSSMLLLPYGIPIAIGTIAYFIWMGMLFGV